MPIWGLSTESDFASPPPGGGCRAKAAEMAGEGGGSRKARLAPTLHEPNKLSEFAERRKFYTEYVHFWSLEYVNTWNTGGIRVEYGRIQASGRSFGIRGKRIQTVGLQVGGSGNKVHRGRRA